MTTKIETADLAGAGEKLLAHSKSAKFTARRGLVVELYPFIYGASARMSAPAISQFLANEQGIRLSSVTINKAIKDPATNWNLFFDLIEPAARTFSKSAGTSMGKLLFAKQYFFNSPENRIVDAAVKLLVREEVAKAAGILRTKWFNIDWEIRLKARPFLEHRLREKGR